MVWCSRPISPFINFGLAKWKRGSIVLCAPPSTLQVAEASTPVAQDCYDGASLKLVSPNLSLKTSRVMVPEPLE